MRLITPEIMTIAICSNSFCCSILYETLSRSGKDIVIMRKSKDTDYTIRCNITKYIMINTNKEKGLPLFEADLGT